ncbi:unnamed protein product [Nesidiocoris tenuis]|uniref:Uncharacterized protein n=1 Tax=Nesidiocoris tenuis TaxID=355587 RepID=A0A6H5HAK1_9HEMI|nr:unnamed protein product [Nesidiocoris tenuis]
MKPNCHAFPRGYWPTAIASIRFVQVFPLRYLANCTNKNASNQTAVGLCSTQKADTVDVEDVRPSSKHSWYPYEITSIESSHAHVKPPRGIRGEHGVQQTADDARWTAFSGQQMTNGGQRSGDGVQKTAFSRRRTVDGVQQTAFSGRQMTYGGRRSGDGVQRTAFSGWRSGDSVQQTD